MAICTAPLHLSAVAPTFLLLLYAVVTTDLGAVSRWPMRRIAATSCLPTIPTPYQGQVFNEVHKPLSGATVLVRGTTTAVSTNADGRFLLSLPTGPHTLVVDYPGCRSRTVPVVRPNSVLVVVLSNTLALRRR